MIDIKKTEEEPTSTKMQFGEKKNKSNKYSINSIIELIKFY
jgi:hypothetical protein